MKLVAYFCVGATAAAVDFAIFFYGITALGFPWFPVAIFSFVVATLTNYLLSIRFVFESRVRFRRRSEIALVFLISAAAAVINQSLLWLTIEMLALNLIAAKIIATAALFFFNFGCRHYFVFRRLPRKNAAAVS